MFIYSSTPLHERGGHQGTATRAVGALLSRGTQHGLGVHGATPSNTSRFFSADFGLVHLIALDLNVRVVRDDVGETVGGSVSCTACYVCIPLDEEPVVSSIYGVSAVCSLHFFCAYACDVGVLRK